MLMAMAFISPHRKTDEKEVEQNLPTAPSPKEVIQFLPTSVPPRKPRQESLRPHPRLEFYLWLAVIGRGAGPELLQEHFGGTSG